MKPLICFLFFLGCSLYLWEHYLKDQKQQERFLAAKELFEQGLKINAPLIKRTVFEEALHLLLAIEPKNASANAAIGTILAHFQEYPLSLSYLLEGAKDDPQNKDLAHQIEEIATANGTPQPLFKHTIPDIPSPLLFIVMGLFACLTLPFLLVPSSLFNRLMIGGILILIPMLGIQVASQFFSPLYGIIIESTPLYTTYSPSPEGGNGVTEPAGMMVKLLDIANNGRWLKVETQEGKLGYIPSTAIRVLH